MGTQGLECILHGCVSVAGPPASRHLIASASFWRKEQKQQQKNSASQLQNHPGLFSKLKRCTMHVKCVTQSEGNTDPWVTPVRASSEPWAIKSSLHHHLHHPYPYCKCLSIGNCNKITAFTRKMMRMQMVITHGVPSLIHSLSLSFPSFLSHRGWNKARTWPDT